MKREDLMKLLGGFAAGTLTEAERRELFAAALQDQELFEALALEEPLRDALSDPYGRRRVLAALEGQPASWRERIRAWLGRRPAVTPELETLRDVACKAALEADPLILASRVLCRLPAFARRAPPPSPPWWRRPVAWGAAGSLAAAVVLCVVLVRTTRTAREEEVRQVAMVRPPAAPEPRAEIATPAPQQPSRKAVPMKREEAPPLAARRTPIPASDELKRAAEKGAAGGAPGPAEFAAHDQRIVAAEAAQAVAEAPAAAGKVAASTPPTYRVAAPPATAPAPAPPAPVAAQATEASREAARPAPKSVIAKQEADVSKRDAAPAMLRSRSRQDAEGARNLFYAGPARTSLMPGGTLGGVMKEKEQAPAANVPVAMRALGLRYTLLRRGPDGRYFELPPESSIAASEDARLRIESNEAAYLYLWVNGAPIFSGPVAAREPQLLPAAPGRVVMVLARQAESGDADTLPERARAAPDGKPLLVDRPAELRPRDQSVYVANPSPAPDARVFAELTLNSR